VAVATPPGDKSAPRVTTALDTTHNFAAGATSEHRDGSARRPAGAGDSTGYKR